MSPEQTPVSLLIAAPDPALRAHMRATLDSRPQNIVVAETANGAECVAAMREYRPEILILDLDLPGRSEVDALAKRCGQRMPRTVAVARSIDQDSVLEAVRLGASGFVAATVAPWVFAETVSRVIAGEYCLESDAVGILLEILRAHLPHANGASQLKEYSLTPREMEIIAKITAGSSNRIISQEFSISERTVKHHLTNIFSKLGVSNRLGLALFAMKNQLPTTSPSAAAEDR